MILLSIGKILRIFTTIKKNSKSPFRIITSRIVINTVHGMVEHDICFEALGNPVLKTR